MIRLCDTSEIAEGDARGFDPYGKGRDSVFVVRKHGQFFAYRDECPHVGGAYMAWRRHAYLDASGEHIACHGHGALFDIVTGRCVHGACLGQSLNPVPVCQDGSGQLVMTDTGTAAMAGVQQP